MGYWCAATGQPAASWLALTTVEHQAFLEVANEIAQMKKSASKRRR